MKRNLPASAGAGPVETTASGSDGVTAHVVGAGGIETVDIAEVAAQLRVDSIRAAVDVGSGHVTSSLSAADLMAVLLARHLRYDWSRPGFAGNDHLIFSKGHASPLLYSMFRAAGVLEPGELTSGYRRRGSRLQGHPTPVLPWVDVATGSLGQGLPIGVGIAMAGALLDRSECRVWVLCGDSEMAEGSIWEALDKAGHYSLGNLTVIVDVNRLGQRGPTALQWDVDGYARRAAAFGALPIVVDGHDVAAIDAAYRQAAGAGVPSVIVARTVKGRGVAEIEDADGWHGKALPPDLAGRAITSLGGVRNYVVAGPGPRRAGAAPDRVDTGITPDHAGQDARPITLPRYRMGDQVATRSAYGAALTAIGSRRDVVAMDAEVSNSTHADLFAEAFPDRFFEMFISECQLIAAAVGMSVRGYRPFASTFAAFVSRGYDFVRMAAISRADIVICGSHAGVEIGADGPSQMALEDLAAMRAVHGSTVLYPCDAASCARLVDAALDRDGIVYLRTTRGKYPVIYGPDEDFPIGGSKLARSGNADDVTIVGAGVTVHTALAAADLLAAKGIAARVIDAYSVKPIDTATVHAAVDATGGRLVVAEDHHPEGGLGSAVLEALAAADALEHLHVAHLAVRTMPGSATPEEQLASAHIDAVSIADAAMSLMSAETIGAGASARTANFGAGVRG